MSDHAWTQDHLAARVAGGLTPAEAERLDAHVAECPACAADLAAARAVDVRLVGLFAAARPGPAFEDRLVRSLGSGDARRPVVRGKWPRRVGWGLAASVGLGAVGGAGSWLADNGVPFPGGGPSLVWLGPGERSSSRAHREAAEGAPTDLTNPDLGLLSDLTKESLGYGNDLTRLPNKRFDLNGVVDSRTPAPGSDQHAWYFRDGSTPPRPVVAGKDVRLGTAPTYGYFTPLDAKPADAQRGERGESALGLKDAGDTAGAGGKPVTERFGRLAETDAKASKSRVLGREGKAADEFGLPALAVEPKPVAAGQPGETRPPAPPAPAPAPAAERKIVIRSGDIEFEVESFDSAVATVTQLTAAVPGAFVATVNSEKLPNGKTRGSVAVRVPPDRLDGFVLDLRKELGKAGELKGVRIGSQDITKQYTDLESRLKAARTMETRLLAIIKDGKGEIKQLLEAEKELGVWRTRIEEIEGELRYYGNLVSLSSLTITLAEKEIRAAAGVVETERVQAGVEVEDVDAAYRQALAAVAEAKGRVTKSEVKQLSAGQFNAALHFEVAPDSSGPMRDRLRQLGRVARLEIDRTAATPHGGPPAKDAKVTRGDAAFQVQLYNLANVAPRETATQTVAVPDVAGGFRAVREAVERAKGRVVTAQLNEGDRQAVTAQLDFEVRRADEPAVLAAVAAAGEVVSRTVARAEESVNVTDTKVLYRTTFLAAARLAPRETTTVGVEVADVDAARAAIAAQVAEAKGTVADARETREANGRATAVLVLDVPAAAAPGVVEALKRAGTVRRFETVRNPKAADGRFALARVEATVTNADLIVPPDDGLWPQVRRGLAYSVTALLASLTWLIFGLFVVLPWAAVAYLVYRLVRRLARRPA
jgi:hypothetical protein